MPASTTACTNACVTPSARGTPCRLRRASGTAMPVLQQVRDGADARGASAS